MMQLRPPRKTIAPPPDAHDPAAAAIITNKELLTITGRAEAEDDDDDDEDGEGAPAKGDGASKLREQREMLARQQVHNEQYHHYGAETRRDNMKPSLVKAAKTEAIVQDIIASGREEKRRASAAWPVFADDDAAAAAAPARATLMEDLAAGRRWPGRRARSAT